MGGAPKNFSNGTCCLALFPPCFSVCSLIFHPRPPCACIFFVLFRPCAQRQLLSVPPRFHSTYVVPWYRIMICTWCVVFLAACMILHHILQNSCRLLRHFLVPIFHFFMFWRVCSCCVLIPGTLAFYMLYLDQVRFGMLYQLFCLQSPTSQQQRFRTC